MRLVLDTNVVVSALIARGVPRELFLLGENEEVRLFTSERLLLEVAGVLRREKFAHLPDMQGNAPANLTLRYRLATQIVRLDKIERVVRSDPDDDFVIATAVEAEADILVTGDKGVLEHHPHRGIQILRPADALRHVRAAIGK